MIKIRKIVQYLKTPLQENGLVFKISHAENGLIFCLKSLIQKQKLISNAFQQKKNCLQLKFYDIWN